MQDFLVILENKQQIILAADKRTLKFKADKLARKFNTKVLEILSTPLRKEPKEKACAFLMKDKCRVTKLSCPFVNRIMSQCQSFTEED